MLKIWKQGSSQSRQNLQKGTCFPRIKSVSSAAVEFDSD